MSPQSSISPFVMVSRLFWMLFGPMLLLLLCVYILNSGTGWVTLVDGAFFVVLGAILLARWIEYRSGHALTATGEPATAAHFRRYALGLLLICGAVWVLANLAGNHWLKSAVRFH